MKRSEVKALYYICPLRNIASILKKGILSYNRVKKTHSQSVADPIIQERRENVVLPGGSKRLHDFANLYFNPRNAMMSKVRARHKQICILRLSATILDEKNVIITDRNASSDYTHFYESSTGLQFLDKNLVYAKDWRHENQFEYWRRKSSACAEILVPGKIDASFISGIFVSCSETKVFIENILTDLKMDLPIRILANLFFQ
jgi:ssDNA thymidine ADP-ribosyltransferase, DarT